MIGVRPEMIKSFAFQLCKAVKKRHIERERPETDGVRLGPEGGLWCRQTKQGKVFFSKLKIVVQTRQIHGIVHIPFN